MVSALSAWCGADVRISIADAPSGWAMASIAGRLSHLAVEADCVTIHLGAMPASSWVVVYFDMVDDVIAGDIQIEIKYAGGDIAVVRQSS